MSDPKTGNYRNSGAVTSQKPALFGQRIIQAEFDVGDPLTSVLTMFYCTIEWKSATSLIPPPLPLNLDSKDLSHGPILRAQLDFIALKSDILILGEKYIIIILR